MQNSIGHSIKVLIAIPMLVLISFGWKESPELTTTTLILFSTANAAL
jgi:hypothetical protein